MEGVNGKGLCWPWDGSVCSGGAHESLLDQEVVQCLVCLSALLQVKARGQDFFEYLCHLVGQEVCREKQAAPRMADNRTGAAAGTASASLTNHHQALACCSDRATTVLDANELDASMLVVSHGAYMRSWVGYFVSDLACTLPATLSKTMASYMSPNTGISQFIVTLENRNSLKPRLSCLFLNRDDHLRGLATEKV